MTLAEIEHILPLVISIALGKNFYIVVSFEKIKYHDKLVTGGDKHVVRYRNCQKC